MKNFFDEVNETLEELKMRYGNVSAYIIAIAFFPLFLVLVYFHIKNK